MPGILYLVPTPIGNLGDLSDRIRQTLECADFIAAEDGAAAAPAQAEPKKEEAPAQTAGGDDKKYFEFGLSE